MDLDDDDNAVGEDLQVKEVSRARAGKSARAADWDFEAGVSMCFTEFTFPSI